MADVSSQMTSSGLGGLGALAVGALGSYLTGQGAAAQAKAANDVLAANIATQQGFANQNQATFANDMAGYAPATQAASLAAAQTARSTANQANISDTDPNDVPITSTAPPAVRSEIAARMLATHNQSMDRAKASGVLGGYGDQWLTNQLGDAKANRDISVVNNLSAGRQSLLAPEQQDAMIGKGSVWGPILGGVGNAIGSAAGGGAFSGVGNYFSGGSGASALPANSTVSDVAAPGAASGFVIPGFS